MAHAVKFLLGLLTITIIMATVGSFTAGAPLFGRTRKNGHTFLKNLSKLKLPTRLEKRGLVTDTMGNSTGYDSGSGSIDYGSGSGSGSGSGDYSSYSYSSYDYWGSGGGGNGGGTGGWNGGGNVDNVYLSYSYGFSPGDGEHKKGPRTFVIERQGSTRTLVVLISLTTFVIGTLLTVSAVWIYKNYSTLRRVLDKKQNRT